MIEAIVNVASNLPHWLAVILLGMVPVGELGLALTVGITRFDMPFSVAFPLAFLGNLIVVTMILLFIDPIARWLRQVGWIDRVFIWLFARTRRNFSSSFKRWGAFGLVIFLAIPSPMSGGWTGSLAAYLFGIPFRIALPLVMAGMALSGLVVAGTTLGIIRLF